MKRILWWCLMYLWCRDATRLYWGPAADSVYFNTACFQQAAEKTLGYYPDSQVAAVWLVSHGWYQGIGGCHWFKTARAANEHWAKMTDDAGEGGNDNDSEM